MKGKVCEGEVCEGKVCEGRCVVRKRMERR